jgi:hypothetical protein
LILLEFDLGMMNKGIEFSMTGKGSGTNVNGQLPIGRQGQIGRIS